ncbi:bacteriocin [Companilactobacillus nuruki]|nr:bacteriocin [Companilactobacillus nuruki]
MMLTKYNNLNKKQLMNVTGGRMVHIWGWIKGKIGGSWH